MEDIIIFPINKKEGMDMSAFAIQMRGLYLFTKYAFPPNRLGYCGPQERNLFYEILLELKEKQEKGTNVKENLLEELRRLSGQFKGAVPYLKIIAKSNGINDFFDRRVVEAYWLGNNLLHKVDFNVFYKDLKKRDADVFLYNNRQTVSGARDVVKRVKPTHIFHVFNIHAQSEFKIENYKIILQAIDSCRIRRGTVLNVLSDKNLKDFQAIVDVQHNFLELDKYGNLRLNDGATGKFFTTEKDLKKGDAVSLHFDYVCDKLTKSQRDNLDRWTEYHIEIFNACRDNIMF